jgi:4-amino-4-deoxy-L-arabinose transferase-like glycosyltransferase
MQFLQWIFNLFNFTNGQTSYLYYDIIIFSLLMVFLAVNAGQIRKYSRAGRTYALALLLLLLAFLLAELLFVTPTHLLYNDEAIYASIAKTILTNHILGICSFSSANYCVPGTAGLFHQPGEWPLMLAMAFSIFGVSFSVGFDLALLLSVLGVALVFYIAQLLFKDSRVSLLAAGIFAFTPLYMTFSRSTIVDLPAAVFGLLAIFSLLIYIRERTLLTGLLTASAIAVTMSIKVDAVIILPIVLAVLLLDSETFKKKWSSRNMFILVGVVVITIVLLFPEFVFLKNAPTITGAGAFGNAPGQPLFSLNYLIGNFTQNTLFWFGKYSYTSLLFNGVRYPYNVEFPASYTVFAIVGLAFLIAKRKFRLVGLVSAWFLIIFVFYTSYYGGSVLYSSGDDVRYFLLAFIPVSMFAAFGLTNAYDYILGAWRNAFSVKRHRIKKRAASRHTGTGGTLLMVVLVALLFSNAFAQFVNIVHAPPSHILPFAAERYDERLIDATYQQIPKSCMVVTFQPPLWYVLGRANIYTTWINYPEYESTFNNMSKGCVYFDRSIDCYLNYGGVDTQLECENFTSTHTLIPVNITFFNNDTWYNVTMGIYAVVPGNSSAAR